MRQLLEAKEGQVKVIDIATARGIHSSHGGAAGVKLQAWAVVCDMDKDGVVWLTGQAQSLQGTAALASSLSYLAGLMELALAKLCAGLRIHVCLQHQA